MRRRSAIAIGMAVAVLAAAALCVWRFCGDVLRSRDSNRGDLATLHLELPDLSSTDWVERYRPEASSPGYNLVLYRRRLPMLIDANGRIVHSWPLVRAVGRARLDRRCRLGVLSVANRLEEYDWQGRRTWSFALPDSDDLLHHDFAQLETGRYVALAQDAASGADYLLEVDRSGDVVWEWHAIEHLDAQFPDRDRRAEDPTHINSVQELPPNRWFDAGDQRFRPGNLLLSARHLNAMFVVERASGDIVWKHDRGLDYQHEALMIEPGRADEGLVVVFDNGFHDLKAYRRSEVLMLNPVEHRPVWRYRADGFFSAVAGTAQPLPNGNVLITSSHGGRVFEVKRSGDIVWQWVPPYLPMRVSRYSPDHCPRLSELDPGPQQAVEPRSGLPFIDKDLRVFRHSGEHERSVVHGRDISVLKGRAGCERLWIPDNATLTLGFGIDTERLRREALQGRFRATLRATGDLGERILVDEPISSAAEDAPWRTRSFPLADLAYQRVELCLDARTPQIVRGRSAERFLIWENPRVATRDAAGIRAPTPRDSPQPDHIQKRLLEALGYAE